MNGIETGMVQMLQLSGGYQEKNIRPGNEKRRRWIRRVILCVFLLFFGIFGVRRGINAYLAKEAEGKLQTASSYKKIYQSFERVESKQLHLRRKWENHRGVNMPLNTGGVNLSSLMSSASDAMSTVLGAVRDVTGVGGFGIGQYHQYMMAVSQESGSSISGEDGDRDGNLSSQDMSVGDQQTGKEQSGIEEGDLSTGEGNDLHSVEEPDQWIAQGDYIYTIWMKDESEGRREPEPRLVIYHAADGQMEKVYEREMGKTNIMEMMILGNYLYLVKNAREYNPAVDEEYYPEHCMLYVYDITNPAKPKRKGVLAQYGSYYSMKIVGEYLYLISKFQDFTAQSHKDTDSYIPKVGEEKIPPEDIYMQRDLYETGYVVISVYHLSDSGKPELTDAKAVAGTGECIQWSSDTIYICSQVVPKRSDRTDRTGVTVLSYRDGKIRGEDHLIVKGSIDMTQETEVNEACLHLPMQVNTYKGSFMKIEGWILPGWEGAPMKIQMQEEADHTEKQNIGIDGIGEKVHETDVVLSKQKIRNAGFEGQLFEVDEMNYIGIGHTDGDKQLKLLWYTFSVDDEPELQSSVSLREYRSPVTLDSRMVYFDRKRSLIGFCATGSKGTFYYLYRYQQNTDSDVVELQELCQENFGNQLQTGWIRGHMLHPEENILYMIRSSSMRIEEMAKPIADL